MMVETRNVRAIDLAKYFMKNELDEPRNTYDGNMKLQKLVYFAQLIHLAKFGEPLFEEPIYAFKNGSVIENVRHAYKYKLDWLVSEANSFDNDFNEEINETLTLTKKIFGDLSAVELSDLNHQQFSWKSFYDRSIDELTNFHHKEESIIDIDSIIEHDLSKVQQLITAVELDDEEDMDFEVINGVTFYYDPFSTILNDEIIKELEEFALECDESVYSFYIDENVGLVIY